MIVTKIHIQGFNDLVQIKGKLNGIKFFIYGI